MKTKNLIWFGVILLFIAFISCQEAVDDVFECAGGSMASCCSFNPNAAECTGFFDEKTRAESDSTLIETDSTLAVAKLPIRE